MKEEQIFLQDPVHVQCRGMMAPHRVGDRERPVTFRITQDSKA